ncbi:hypothetical protein [Arsenophonus endosymbiont of Bemisia tabaci]|uniref:hypothetical protein n=1 Tax=Arsenophonus endosymbiont of Bemisia tabaci TaxID=536059 RepID=UPI0015F41A1B|nr:hypothetical protein [Arsenophonus endosymbiont of Bemisia tabaci]CAA2931244.1 hypothetical protein ARSQ2_02396 [Arsenophonus endosymbiont of Bemisia tabaci Q2]
MLCFFIVILLLCIRAILLFNQGKDKKIENTIAFKINNDKTLETSLDELYQSYSQIDESITDYSFGDQLDKFSLKEINESKLQMADSIVKIANILTDAIVTFPVAKGTVVTIVDNINQLDPINSLAAVITQH